MGQTESKPEKREIPIEQLSHELALRFASKCFSHLEIAHFKDNFKTLADHQDDVEYWKEETVCSFLALPEPIRAGSVIYAMTTYLGAFPFPSLAPCIVTREAMLKVITLFTDRYKKVLKRGDQDKNKLLFRSLAVFDRRSSVGVSADQKMQNIIQQQQGDAPEDALEFKGSGFAIDQPLDDEEDEDDDDLALAALDALDAIEVFKEDRLKDRKIHHAHVPIDNLERLVVLLLLLAPLTPQDNIAATCGLTDENHLARLEQAAKAIVLAFDPEGACISYASFIKTMTMLTPQLFRPLNPLFEHFLFSKQLDLSKHQGQPTSQGVSYTIGRSPLQGVQDQSSTILNDTLLAQLASSIEITATASPASSSFFHCGARFNQLYSTASHGTSLSSFSRQVMSWRSASMFILKGTDSDSGTTYIFGAFLPEQWKEAGSPSHDTETTQSKAVMLQLQPRHALFRANPHNRTTAVSHFSTKTGIALGCVIPATSRVNAQSQMPVLGPVSLLINDDISTATFQHSGDAGIGAFLTDPLLEESQRSNKSSTQREKVEIDIDGLEVWGVSFPVEGEEDEITRQKKRLDWEEAEAARRKGLNFGGDKEGARHLLEMAGIVGPDAGNRSGGSV